jgi:O-antigen ligase
LIDAPASSANIGPTLADSPILGVGPQKNQGVAVFDNEYASFLAHYGALGLISYVALFLAAFVVAVRAALRASGWAGMLGVALAAFTIALGVFAVPAGAFRQLQVMLIFWLMIGMASAIMSMDRTASRPPTMDPS